ncbi:MAG: DUF5908 family protein [Bacteroidota bacterium]
MPIEIRELVIKAVVDTQSSKQSGSGASGGGRSDDEESNDQLEYLKALVQSMEDKNER